MYETLENDKYEVATQIIWVEKHLLVHICIWWYMMMDHRVGILDNSKNSFEHATDLWFQLNFACAKE